MWLCFVTPLAGELGIRVSAGDVELEHCVLPLGMLFWGLCSVTALTHLSRCQECMVESYCRCASLAVISATSNVYCRRCLLLGLLVLSLLGLGCFAFWACCPGMAVHV